MLAWRIALRYLRSKKSHSAVNIISLISVAGVAVATAAIVIVLSVFNGFSSLTGDRLDEIDADIKVLPAAGKTLDNADSIAAILEAMPEVVAAQAVVEERALLRCGQKQMPIIFKGVGEQYGAVTAVGGLMIDGEMAQQAYGYPALTLSVGAALGTDARPGSLTTVYVPRRVGRINPANPSAAFRAQEMMATGVFQAEQPEYDDQYVYIPIESARYLLEYDNSEGSAIEARLNGSTSAKGGRNTIAAELKRMGIDAKVLTRREQEESSFRMIMIEKWVTFMMLAFILAIAAFNIISTLSLLVIEKRDNMDTLRALGAPSSLVKNIFICQGWLISAAGGVAGIALGAALTLAQQWGHLIKLKGDPSQLTIAYYPVRLLPADLLAVMALIAIVAIVSSQATRLFNK